VVELPVSLGVGVVEQAGVVPAVELAAESAELVIAGQGHSARPVARWAALVLMDFAVPAQAIARQVLTPMSARIEEVEMGRSRRLELLSVPPVARVSLRPRL